MLFTIRNTIPNIELCKFNIVSENGYMGIINSDDSSIVLPIQYDNIFVYGENIFVLHKKGKIGAVKIDSNNFFFYSTMQIRYS